MAELFASIAPQVPVPALSRFFATQGLALSFAN